jgi:hypothetical protein
MKWRLDHGQIEVVDDIMVPFLRVKTPAERIAMVGASYRTARMLIAGGLRGAHPDWSEERIAKEVVRRMTRGAN